MLNLRKAPIVNNQSGFTLLEVMISLTLLTVGLLGTAALTAGVVKGNINSARMTTATTIAQTCLEENRRVGYTTAGAVPSGGSNDCVSGTATIIQNGVSYTRTLTITPTPANSTNIRTLTVTVSWSEGSVGNKAVTLSTILASL